MSHQCRAERIKISAQKGFFGFYCPECKTIWVREDVWKYGAELLSMKPREVKFVEYSPFF